MFTEPGYHCLTHGWTRFCSEHRRAEFPPEAARKWLKKHCPERHRDGKPCDLVYRAGVQPRGTVVGQ